MVAVPVPAQAVAVADQLNVQTRAAEDNSKLILLDMKILYILPVLFLFTLSASAQNEEDALRFSRIVPFGSERVTEMGGAFTALGGILTTL